MVKHMNKLKVISIAFLTFFSFYYTNKIALYVQNQTPLKKEIIAYSKSSEVQSVDAKIDGNYIIPGLNGIKVDIDKTFSNMKKINHFDKNSLVISEVSPKVSIKSYPDKIIIGGNKNKKAISLILENSNIKINSNNITYKKTSKYCIKVSESDCINNKTNIVKPSKILSNTNFLYMVSSINNGDIIYVKSDLLTEYINYLIKQIEYNGLKILKLEDHISEKNNV